MDCSISNRTSRNPNVSRPIQTWDASTVKVRIGFGPGIGQAGTTAEWFAGFVDDLEKLGFDSLWLPERLGGPTADPLVGLAFAAGRTKRLKLGTSVLVLPGRNPIVLAKELATLDALSGGRFLLHSASESPTGSSNRRSGWTQKSTQRSSTRLWTW